MSIVNIVIDVKKIHKESIVLVYEKTEKRNFKNLNNYAKYYEKAKEAIGSRMRIERIYLYIKNNIKDRDLLTNIEKVIENHRISQRGIN